MGQQTFGLLYGVNLGSLEDMDAAAYGQLYDDLDEVHAALMYFDAAEPYILAGYWVAVGASGKTGKPYLEHGVKIADIEHVYARSYETAVAAWPKVEAILSATLSAAGNFKPTMWIAETEVG